MRNPTKGLGGSLLLTSLLLALFALLVWVTGFDVLAIQLIAVAFVSAEVIRVIVRWVNRRDDPHAAKRPPDTP